MDPETQRWAWGIAGTIVLALLGLLFRIVWAEIKRVAKNQHDTNNVVDRHEKWITVIREKLGIGPRE